MSRSQRRGKAAGLSYTKKTKISQSHDLDHGTKEKELKVKT